MTGEGLRKERRRSFSLRRSRPNPANATAFQYEWRRKVVPMRIEQARRAIQDLQDQRPREVLGAELESRTWLVLTLRLEGAANPDLIAARALDSVWPGWRENLG
jgi:hypothetical protein